MPQGQKTWSKKRPKGIKKETTNIYQPHSISLYFPSEKQTKNILFFCNNSKKNQSPFFCNIFKEKKASFKNLCHSIPKRLNLNTTVPLLRILPSHLYSTLYGTEKLELFLVLQYLCSKRYLPFFFIVRSVLFQLKLSMFQLPSVTKLFFSSGFGEINKKQPSSLTR